MRLLKSYNWINIFKFIILYVIIDHCLEIWEIAKEISSTLSLTLIFFTFPPTKKNNGFYWKSKVQKYYFKLVCHHPFHRLARKSIERVNKAMWWNINNHLRKCMEQLLSCDRSCVCNNYCKRSKRKISVSISSWHSVCSTIKNTLNIEHIGRDGLFEPNHHDVIFILANIHSLKLYVG